ncbi:MAG TPA: class III extradiol dioxygenase subunit B-like domain-containing protein [Blastocatellia bacterium]|nr:class III extradiol dioxygenase subunit B-like domain-containing protein [Blastocatellia bacterium]
MADPIVFAGIAPHPPLLVPEIGGSRIESVSSSQQALREFSQRLIRSGPETVIVISPHSPLDPNYFTARSAPKLRGDFREFHAPEVSLAFDNDIELLNAIRQASGQEGVGFRKLDRDYPLDHGAMVPLYYLWEAGWRGNVAVIGFTSRPCADHVAFGRAIACAARFLNRRVALVASGDLSHRLIVGGPYEYEPTAHLFDEQIVAATARGDARAVIEVDEELRLRAGECGYRSIVMALGCVDCAPPKPEVLSYEGPFGVGYMVAVLADGNC